MLKIDRGALEQMEKRYQGITASMIRFENAELPSCPHCGIEQNDNTPLENTKQ